MKLWSAASTIVAIALAAESARAQAPNAAHDPAVEARDVFARKCAGCHGPDLPKPQGRFGYVLDLRRVASNPEMVIPGKPDESELWVLVARGDMPPTDSPRGPLTAVEKEAVRAWIASGAPEVRVPPTGITGAPEPEQPVAVPARSAAERTVRFVGKFHLLLLHFPIALLIAAGSAECLAFRRGTREPSSAARFCLTLATVAVVPTVALGWLHAASGNGLGATQLLNVHRWLGTATGAIVIVATLCAWRDARRGARGWSGRATLVVGMVLVVATAHAGGLLAHGRDFFDW